MQRATTLMLALTLLGVPACAGDADTTTDTDTDADIEDRTILFAEADGVRAAVADCFVVDVNGEHRYQTTIEVDNNSDRTHSVAVTIVADLGRGGTSDTFDVPAGGLDAWAVTAEATTDDPVGDAECTSFVNAVELILDG